MSEQQRQTDIDLVLRTFWADGVPKNFVNGGWVEPVESKPVFNPSTGLEFSSAPESNREEVGVAVDAALVAQREWRARTPAERALVFSQIGEKLSALAEDFAFLESVDSGNPLASTRRDVGLALKYLAEWPGIAAAQHGRFTKPHRDGFSLVSAEPYGVVGKIIAYNHPLLFALAGAIFPLMAGNGLVIKTSAQTPLSTLALGAVLKGTLPDGLVNILGGGAEAGDALVTHPEVKRIAFTGSDRTALAIQERLSKSGTVKHFSAELGGKNPFVMFDDCDVAEATEAAFAGLSFTVSAGQSCQSTAKILVQQTIFDEVVTALSRRMDGLRVGPAYEENTEMGPVVSLEHLRTVRGMIDQAVHEGATLVTGGPGCEDEAVGEGSQEHHAGGYYLKPTLVTGVTEQMSLFSQEVFGPVAVVMPFADEAEAVRLANKTEYGLSAAVWTRDLDRALRVSESIQAGYIWVNDANRHYPGSPFGGMGKSGVGREESVDELASFVELKSVNIKVRAS